MKWAIRGLAAVGGLLVLLVAGLWAASMREGAGRMSSSVVIDRQASVIWPYLTEPEKLKSWVGWLVEVKEPEGPLRGVGGRQIWVMEDRNNGNQLMNIEGRIKVFEPQRELVVSTEAMEGFTGIHTYRLEEAGAGKTRLVVEADYKFAHWFARLLSVLIMSSAGEKLNQDLLRLKAKAEAAARAHS